jgi:hypothetical protein
VWEKGKTQQVPVGGVGFVFDGQSDQDGMVVAGVDFDQAVTLRETLRPLQQNA